MNPGRGARAQWIFVSVLALCCAVLAFLQYRWTGEITTAERDRLRADLHDRLLAFRQDFEDSISKSAREFLPRFTDEGGIRSSGVAVQPCPFRRAGIAIFHPDRVEWLRRDSTTGGFVPDQLPPEWSLLREENGAGPRLLSLGDDVLTADLHGFGDEPPHDFRPRALLVAQIDRACIQQKLIPALAAAHLSSRGQLQYELKVVGDASSPIYTSNRAASPLNIANAEDSVPLDFVIRDMPPDRGHAIRKEGMNGPSEGDRGFTRFRPPNGPGAGRFPGPPPDELGKRWLLLVRHKAGSLEALVETERRWNLTLSGGILLLILLTAGALVRFTRASQRLAELRMNIVAGVSHELRSPLTVIRTAAFNLQREGFAGRPQQVRRYGELIGAETTRLEHLIENVLRFAALNSKRAQRQRQSVNVAELLASELDFLADVFAASDIHVDRDIPPDLPRIPADEAAVRHAIRNILENAIKYGGSAGWIGVSAKPALDVLEIRIADRGPGIPPQERTRIFEPFFRGARAIRQQAPGAGLGLSLAAEIVRDHGGTIAIGAETAQGAEIIVRLPLALPHRKPA